MDAREARKYYSRIEIQRALVSFGRNREIGVRYDGYFGKRPDVLEYLSDVKPLVEGGVFSFHMSEERWENPLLLGNENLSEDERAKNRLGWDLILDLDGVNIVYAKIVGKIILDFFEEIGVKNSSVKFSGNKGFHIGVPFEAFSREILGLGETRLLFPEAARRIASYLMCELKGRISKEILRYEGGIENIARKYGFEISDLVTDDSSSMNFAYMKLIEIDTILISTRHLFRMPYSLNEKSGLVSIPVRNDLLMDFERFIAKPEKVDPKKYEKFEFLRYDEKYGKDADILLIKAYEDDYFEMLGHAFKKDRYNREGEFHFEINEEISVKEFPKSIEFALNHNFEDGRKRALFLLLTFLYSINWNEKSIRDIINDWNNKLGKPLKTNYIEAQFYWFKNQSRKISPPNFDNAGYYEDIGIPREIIEKDRKRFKVESKNPLHYVYLMTRKRVKKEK